MSGTARRAVCPGSFDPVTRGHLDIIERAVQLFDEVVVAVGRNPGKNALFQPSERVDLLARACSSWPGVSVCLFDGLLVDFCRVHGAQVIVKGVRSSADFDYELPMTQMNRSLTGIDTVLLPTSPQWSYVSSSLVREVALLGGDVAQFLPAGVAELTVERVRARVDG